MKRFKITYLRSGHVYKPVYANSVKGAVRLARKQGFTDYKGGPMDSRPDRAEVYERVEDDCGGWRWELVATIKGTKIEAEDCQSRLSYKRADERMTAAKNCMERTHVTMMAFNNIANKEYAKEQKKV